MVKKEDVMKVLKTCYDPEIPVSVVDLGLIYEVKVSGSKVNIEMTLTNPMCPMARYITDLVKGAVEGIKGVKEVEVKLVFDPPWSPDKMSASAKKKLGMK